MSIFKKLFRGKPKFVNSGTYWEDRYKKGGDSGRGSFGRLADFKAEFLNKFVEKNQIESIAEFGCGDSNQLKKYNFPSYIGIDISDTAIKKCKEVFNDDGSKKFFLLDEVNDLEVDLAISIDVLYHLVEDDIYKAHLEILFDSSKSYVIIYSTNEEIYNKLAPHVKHRKFTEYVEVSYRNFELIEHIPNNFPHDPSNHETSRADFFIYKKR